MELEVGSSFDNDAEAPEASSERWKRGQVYYSDLSLVQRSLQEA